MVMVPERERRRLESAIESVAALWAICEQVTCVVCSPAPRSVFFEPLSEPARSWLLGNDGIAQKVAPRKHGGIWTPFGVADDLATVG
jgi:hypothetical protein